ncbi:choice-of-anchor G family protein [Microbacterium sp. MPKO10]|uniref:choice-of-anchor G family protein n=1 Tax=Microbacterium sp. MPKO10 TaxID=2989818 RepID=UPI002235742C|nr:choice-of-anchor G family protein [Microbacterium sp. MPKO10]MCW4458683.1 choice-of-anchor G family protein [Microbacterium sp. MPKO10]
MKLASVVGTAALVTFGSVTAASPASALESDTAEAEGRLISGDGTINLNDIAELAEAYKADPSNPGEQSSAIDLAVLDALNIDLGDGVQLFGPNGVIGVGALGQYASASPGDAYASSGAITSEGAIAIGGNGAEDNAFLDLTALLDNAGLGGVTDGLISELRVELGAISASAEQNGDAPATGDYQVANGTLNFTSPAVSNLVGSLSDVLGELNTTVNGITGPEGALGSALSGIADDLVEPLTDALNGLSLGAVSVSNVNLTAGLTVDLQDALSALTDEPLTDEDSALTIDFSTGNVQVDLAKLIADSQGGTYDGTLNGLDPNTNILEPGLIKAGLDGAIGTLLDQIPALIVNAATDAVNNAALELHLTADASLLVVPLANIDILLSGTVGDFLGVDGSQSPAIDTSGTTVLGGAIPVGELLEPVLSLVTDTLLPAVVQPLSDAITEVGILDTTFRPAVELVETALEPLADVLSQVATITVNVQESDGNFTNEDGYDPGSFTQRAVSVTLLPVLDTPLAQVNLASATVRTTAAEVADVVITSPADGDVIEVEEGATVDQEVTGTGEPGSEVTVSIDGQDDQVTTVGDDGTWSVTFPGLPEGTYEATATDGTTTDDVSFTIEAEAAADTEATDTEATDTEATDTEATDTEATDTEATDTEATDTEATDTEATDTEATDTEATDTEATDTEATDTEATDTEATDTEATDTEATDTEATDTEATDTEATDTEATDTEATDTEATDTEATDTEATDTEATDTEATDTEATDTEATDTEATDTEATDTEATDTEATDTEATDTEATDTEAADTEATDADAADADASDADATDSDASDGGDVDAPQATVKYESIVRGTGVTQEVYGTGFAPGETVSGTVHSTPFELEPTEADSNGNVTFTFAVDNDFELGAHRVDLVGSESGELTDAQEDTNFTVTAPVSAGNNAGDSLPVTGSDGGLLLGGLAALLTLLGAALVLSRKKQTS